MVFWLMIKLGRFWNEIKFERAVCRGGKVGRGDKNKFEEGWSWGLENGR